MRWWGARVPEVERAWARYLLAGCARVDPRSPPMGEIVQHVQ